MVLRGTTRTQWNQPRETLVPTGYVISFSLNEVDEQGVLRVVKEPGVHIPRKVKGQAAGLTATVHDDGAVVPVGPPPRLSLNNAPPLGGGGWPCSGS